MEKNQKSSSELNGNPQNSESNKIEQEKTSSNDKESNTINPKNLSQKNDSLFRPKNTNNNLFSNSESLYPLLFT